MRIGRKLYYYNSKMIVMPCYNCKRTDRGLIIPTCVSKVSHFALIVAGILGNGGGPRYLQKELRNIWLFPQNLYLKEANTNG